MYHSFLIHSSADGYLGCFHVLAIYKQCCNEHWGTCVSFNYGFLSVYAQQEAKIYNGEKTISLTSDTGKTGQPLVKE